MRGGVAGPTRLRIVRRSSSGDLAIFAAIRPVPPRGAARVKYQLFCRALGQGEGLVGGELKDAVKESNK
jgi:hypothetical protein